MLLKEMHDDLADAKHGEDTSQRDYEKLMAESAASRAQKQDSSTAKAAAKADLEVNLENTAADKSSASTELANVKQFIAELHGSCDFLVENFDLRKAARANEV